MMKTLLGLCLLTLSLGAHAEPINLGQGKLDCAAFIKVVNGNFHSPLGALQFHGYISWALGMLSGYNRQADAQAQFHMNTEDLKMTLIDSCEAHPKMAFADAVWQLGGRK